MTRRLVRLAGVVGSVCAAGTAQGQETLRLVEPGVGVIPERVAPAVLTEEGVWRVGDWLDYEGGYCGWIPLFDCYGDEDWDGVPDDAGVCGLGAGRWCFGTGYNNCFVTNDMHLYFADLDAGLCRVDLAWFWTVGGWGTSEPCVIGVFTQESVPCSSDSLDYSGWLIDFGTLPFSGQGYYYSDVDIGRYGVWPAPSTGDGSYVLAFLQDVFDSGEWVPATCAQPMLWGTWDARGEEAGWGSQGALQFDDDDPPDGRHTPNECADYSFGVCPDPLGAMVQFWGSPWDGRCDLADCDDDGRMDTRDFVCYLNRWAAGDWGADLDWNGVVDTRDFIFFLFWWSHCR